MPGVRKLIALLCLAALLFVALAPNSHGLAPAWIAPFWLFLAILVCVSIGLREQQRDPRPSPIVCLILSRAPPGA